MQKIRLGLIGAGIKRSQAPRLHILAGKLCGLDVSYELLDLNENSACTFQEILEHATNQGFHGVNITHPSKEEVAKIVTVPDPETQRIGAVNTLRFSDETGHNTDYSGFIKAFRRQFGGVSPGKVLMLGAGGVGKAVAFALLKLDANTELTIVDNNKIKAETLAKNLQQNGLKTIVRNIADLPALTGIDGLLNCTPLGMYQHPGSAFPKHLIEGKSWAFDAVYTPLETEFLANAKKAKLDIMSGYELFFHQGIDAFKIFTDQCVDERKLRQSLMPQPDQL